MIKKIPYNRQYIDGKDNAEVLKALKSKLITTGNFVIKYEKKIKKFLNSKYAVSCSSGTSALHLSMLAIGLKKGDVVIMPAINFIASYSISKMMGAKIFFADVDKYTGQMTPETLSLCIKKNRLKKIKLVITMYLGGYPENIYDFYKLKKKKNFFIIEDACHALGASYKFNNKQIMVGSCKHSDLAIFSTHPVKSITTGEGGIVTTNNELFYKKIKSYRSHGIRRKKNTHWHYDIVETGFNYRLSDINCALGLSQLSKLKKFIQIRNKKYSYYLSKFKKLNNNLLIHDYTKKNKSAFHLFMITINFSKINSTKNKFFRYLKNNKILAQFHYIPLYKFSFFKGKKNIYPNSEYYYKTKISLPLFYNISKIEQNFIINKISNFIRGSR